MYIYIIKHKFIYLFNFFNHILFYLVLFYLFIFNSVNKFYSKDTTFYSTLLFYFIYIYYIYSIYFDIFNFTLYLIYSILFLLYLIHFCLYYFNLFY